MFLKQHLNLRSKDTFFDDVNPYHVSAPVCQNNQPLRISASLNVIESYDEEGYLKPEDIGVPKHVRHLLSSPPMPIQSSMTLPHLRMREVSGSLPSQKLQGLFDEKSGEMMVRDSNYNKCDLDYCLIIFLKLPNFIISLRKEAIPICAVSSQHLILITTSNYKLVSIWVDVTIFTTQKAPHVL